MSRAALLPTPGDPFLLNFWLKFYKRFWMDEVDRLYVYVNSAIEPEAVTYMRNLVNATPKAVWLYTDHQIEHGDALKRMVELATEDHLLLIEDDGFIFKPGKVDECFRLIEEGRVDVVGSRRGSCSQWLYDTASEVFGLDNSGFGDNGPALWPNFLFARREDLVKLRNMGARSWEAGEVVAPVRGAAPELQASDTFVEASLELRAAGLRIHSMPQYHLNVNPMEDYNDQKNIWDGLAAWMHVGSLSSGINGILVDDKGRPLGRRRVAEPSPNPWPIKPNNENEKMEYERRLVWFILAHQYSKPERLTDLRDEYKAAIGRVVDAFGLSSTRMEKNKLIFEGFLP